MLAGFRKANELMLRVVSERQVVPPLTLLVWRKNILKQLLIYCGEFVVLDVETVLSRWELSSDAKHKDAECNAFLSVLHQHSL